MRKQHFYRLAIFLNICMQRVNKDIDQTWSAVNWFQVVQINNWSCITSPPTYPDVNDDVDVTKTMPTQ